MSVVPLNNLSIVLAASMFIVCLSVEAHSPWFTTFLVLGIFTCAVNRLFLNAEKFLVSRDWVVVLSDGNTLSSLNATLTALDQLTNVISPIITGVLVTAWGLRVTCAIFGAFSLVSMASKAFFLRALYVRKPKLAHKEREATKEKCEEDLAANRTFKRLAEAAVANANKTEIDVSYEKLDGGEEEKFLFRQKHGYGLPRTSVVIFVRSSEDAISKKPCEVRLNLEGSWETIESILSFRQLGKDADGSLDQDIKARGKRGTAEVEGVH
nr:unnamed protein product [Haemonchus contortus]